MQSAKFAASATRNAGNNSSAKHFWLFSAVCPTNGPLNPRITGRIESGNYTIEKVIFESLPGFFVTANVYRPNQPGRYPGVLLQSGHTQEGKVEPQLLGANLALKG